jgi:CHAD domain-containing protein
MGAVHLTRVASRRLREVLPLLLLDEPRTRALRHRLRRVTRQLGPVRELDVLGLLVRELGERRQYAGAALTQLEASIADEGAQARRRLAARLPAEKLARLARDLTLAVEPAGTSTHHPRAAPEATGRSGALLEVRLARRAKELRLAIEQAGVLYVPERLHAVRIAVKKLRYALEPLRAAGNPQRTADVAALKAVQEHLGRLRDLDVLIARVRDRQAEGPIPSVAHWRELTRLVRRLESDGRLLHAHYLCDQMRTLAIADRVNTNVRPPQRIERQATG